MDRSIRLLFLYYFLRIDRSFVDRSIDLMGSIDQSHLFDGSIGPWIRLINGHDRFVNKMDRPIDQSINSINQLTTQ